MVKDIAVGLLCY